MPAKLDSDATLEHLHPTVSKVAVFLHQLGGDGGGVLGAFDSGEGGHEFLPAVELGGVSDLKTEGLGHVDEQERVRGRFLT